MPNTNTVPPCPRCGEATRIAQVDSPCKCNCQPSCWSYPSCEVCGFHGSASTANSEGTSWYAFTPNDFIRQWEFEVRMKTQPDWRKPADTDQLLILPAFTVKAFDTRDSILRIAAFCKRHIEQQDYDGTGWEILQTSANRVLEALGKSNIVSERLSQDHITLTKPMSYDSLFRRDYAIGVDHSAESMRKIRHYEPLLAALRAQNDAVEYCTTLKREALAEPPQPPSDNRQKKMRQKFAKTNSLRKELLEQIKQEEKENAEREKLQKHLLACLAEDANEMDNGAQEAVEFASRQAAEYTGNTGNTDETSGT